MFKDYFQGKCGIPTADSCFDYYLNEKELKLVHWENAMPKFEYDPKIPFFQLIVPTVDTYRYSQILDMLIKAHKPIFFTGKTGVGKSIILQKYLQEFKDANDLVPVFLNFSTQTNSYMT